MKYYICPKNSDLMHYGVLGMKWGVRRYQPYSVVPRKSGQTGKELGEAKRADKIAKKNLDKAIKVGKKTIGSISKMEGRSQDKIDRINRTYKTEEDRQKKITKYDLSNNKKYNKLKESLSMSLNEISKAASQIGQEKVDQMLRSSLGKDIRFSVIAGNFRYANSVIHQYYPIGSYAKEIKRRQYVNDTIDDNTQAIYNLIREINKQRGSSSQK